MRPVSILNRMPAASIDRTNTYRYRKGKAWKTIMAFPLLSVPLWSGLERLLQIVEQRLGHDLGSGSQHRAIDELSLGKIRGRVCRTDPDQRGLLGCQSDFFLAQVTFLGVQLADRIVQRNALLADISQSRENGGGCRA